MNSFNSLLAIIAENNARQTRLLFEAGKEHLCYYETEIFIRQLLHCFNTSWERNKAFLQQHLINCYKAPLVLAPFAKAILLFLGKVKTNNGIYVVAGQIEKIKKLGTTTSKIIFSDGTKLKLDCNIRVIKAQYNKYLNLLNKLHQAQYELLNGCDFNNLVVEVERQLG